MPHSRSLICEHNCIFFTERNSEFYLLVVFHGKDFTIERTPCFSNVGVYIKLTLKMRTLKTPVLKALSGGLLTRLRKADFQGVLDQIYTSEGPLRLS